jgi:hypothetical protein
VFIVYDYYDQEFEVGKISPAGYVAVEGDSDYSVPLDSYIWTAEHGISGSWMSAYTKDETGLKQMYNGETYLVTEEWYEQNR